MTFKTNKFPRILHFNFSPGAKNDDRIASDDYFEYLKGKELIFTEKIDGENTCLKQDGVFARTHAVPTHNPWSSYLWSIYDTILPDLGDLEIFGENMYAIHSIEYEKLNSYFYMFAVRQGGKWYSWEETKFVADFFNFTMVPAVDIKEWSSSKNLDEAHFRLLIEMASKKSQLGNTCEGVVVRLADEFDDNEDSTMGYNVLKYVRANHVQTDEHWTRNWKKVKLCI